MVLPKEYGYDAIMDPTRHGRLSGLLDAYGLVGQRRKCGLATSAMRLLLMWLQRLVRQWLRQYLLDRLRYGVRRRMRYGL